MTTAAPAAGAAPRRPFFRRRKSCPFTGTGAPSTGSAPSATATSSRLPSRPARS